MDGVTTPGLVLIFVFVVVLLALAAQLTYVLRYLRRFQRDPPGADDPEVAAAAAAAATGDPYGSPSSKELLLYFICLRNQPQNERALATVTPVYAFSPSPPGFPWPRATAFPPDAKPLPPPPPPLPPPLRSELTKWGDAYATEVLSAVAGREEGEMEAVVSTEDTVVSDGEAAGKEQKEEVVVEEGGDFEFEVVPSSTPFCSSRFYTPPMSPPRGVEGGWELELSQEADGPAPDEEGFLSSEEMVPGGD